jgi:outer membrane protein assembly factor BamA
LAVGLGLRLDLPIGPVRLEYGYNLTKGPGEPTGTLHFAIGITF